jgi:hypothetical protein
MNFYIMYYQVPRYRIYLWTNLISLYTIKNNCYFSIWLLMNSFLMRGWISFYRFNWAIIFIFISGVVLKIISYYHLEIRTIPLNTPQIYVTVIFLLSFLSFYYYYILAISMLIFNLTIKYRYIFSYYYYYYYY